MLTDFHAKLLAHELTRQHASDAVEKLGHALADAQVDLNPHQVDAALFAFRSPFSKGAVLADEVGLGKTIEAGLLLAQKWAERKRRLLIITPANLRKQWAQEMADKFHLPSVILEKGTFEVSVRKGNLNPFQQPAAVICSYQFVRSHEPYVVQAGWDLVVVDEAHRLRNVYRKNSKIALAVKQAISAWPKVLLTATPLQNSLLELYGLVSIIDDYAFGDLDSFKVQFARLGGDSDFTQLKARLAPLCKRTLRRQVLAYVKYTNRHALVQEFFPSEEEQRLYDLVSAYLQRDHLHALPASQRQLVTLILRKLLSSSTFAIASTLAGMVERLEAATRQAEAVTEAPPDLPDNWEQVDELADEWDGDDDGASQGRPPLTPQQVAEVRREMEELREFHALAKSIHKNSKGEQLLTALHRGFEASEKAQTEQGAATLRRKAVIFTESRRTQEYLLQLVEGAGFRGKVVLFNGTNTDAISKAIYKAWLGRHAGTDRITGSPSADMRAALVEKFRDDAEILIATEAAAEGINLQFCNLVVNFDLPWNPQRIEQRIGRCHRYGQVFDVVVVNFLNKTNAADQRVYQLLDEKFRLFSGVFGASDEVLGAVEVGVDFEKRIAGIYQKCRTPEQIQFEFDQLQRDLEIEITAGQRDAREKLLDNFDAEVIEKVRIASRDTLDKFNDRLWQVTRHVLRDDAEFDEGSWSFRLRKNPFAGEAIHEGPYHLGKQKDGVNTYRAGHPLAQRVLALAGEKTLASSEITLDLSATRKRINVLEPVVGKSGWLRAEIFSISAAETEDHVLMAAVTDDGQVLDAHQCRRLFDVEGTQGGDVEAPTPVLESLTRALDGARAKLVDDLGTRNGRWFDAEMDKLDQWAEDRRGGLKAEVDDLDRDLREAKKAARQAPTLPEKLARQKEARVLEARRDDAYRTYDRGVREIDQKKEQLLDEITRRLEPKSGWAKLFTVRWRLV